MFAFVGLLLLTQCAMAKEEGYRVYGTAEKCVDGDTVYLCDMQGLFQMVPVDTTILKNGQFEFTGSYDGAVMRFILPMHENQCVGMATIILENADIEVQVKAEGTSPVKGGPTAALYKEFEEGVEAAYGGSFNKYLGIESDTTKSTEERANATAQIEIIRKRVAQYKYDFCMNHIPSPVSDMILPQVKTDVTKEQFDNILKKMEESGKTYIQYKEYKAEQEAIKATAIGQKYTDLSLNSPEGKPVKVSDYVGKNRFVLIDFWASWCGPCIKEMPWVVKAYEAYHSKGFEVIGISLDNDKEAWVKAIEKYNMPWPHMSDLKGWQCEAAKPYNVQAIPANVLIDKDGLIVAKNLREQDLLDTLEKCFAE